MKVAVGVGVIVAVEVGVTVGNAVGVKVAVTVGVAVGDGVGVKVAVAVSVAVGIAVGVKVAVGTGVAVGIDLATAGGGGRRSRRTFSVGDTIEMTNVAQMDAPTSIPNVQATDFMLGIVYQSRRAPRAPPALGDSPAPRRMGSQTTNR